MNKYEENVHETKKIPVDNSDLFFPEIFLLVMIQGRDAIVFVIIKTNYLFDYNMLFFKYF